MIYVIGLRIFAISMRSAILSILFILSRTEYSTDVLAAAIPPVRGSSILWAASCGILRDSLESFVLGVRGLHRPPQDPFLEGLRPSKPPWMDNQKPPVLAHALIL